MTAAVSMRSTLGKGSGGKEGAKGRKGEREEVKGANEVDGNQRTWKRSTASASREQAKVRLWLADSHQHRMEGRMTTHAKESRTRASLGSKTKNKTMLSVSVSVSVSARPVG